MQGIGVSEAQIPPRFHAVSVVTGLIEMSLNSCKSKPHQRRAPGNRREEGQLHRLRHRNGSRRPEEHQHPQKIISSAKAPGQHADDNRRRKGRVLSPGASSHRKNAAQGEKDKGHPVQLPFIRIRPAALVPDDNQNLRKESEIEKACSDPVGQFFKFIPH